MDTIRTYLENIFQSLPKSDEIMQLKKELLVNMEEKYEELKASGKTENEAIGIVIAEFGNIDEIVSEMGIDTKLKERGSETYFKTISLNEAKDYMNVKKYVSKLVSMGVFLILFGVVILIVTAQFMDEKLLLTGVPTDIKEFLPVIFLLIFIVVAVCLFIYAGMHEEPYKFIEEGEFELTASTKASVQNEYDRLKYTKNVNIMIGVALCILSPIAIFIGAMFSDTGAVIGVCILLLIIATAVAILINSGTDTEAYKKLLKLEDYRPESRKGNRVIGAVAGLVWPLASFVFLFAGLVYDAWDICWIVFPITGVVFGGFCAIYKAVKGEN